ncbi:MAG: hypothetical protein ACI8ZW_002556 [Yoonia sp.]|jgi:hypothetical protein
MEYTYQIIPEHERIIETVSTQVTAQELAY